MTKPIVERGVRSALAATAIRPDEALFAEIASEVPSYGGHFFAGDGSITVYVKNPGEYRAAERLVAQKIGRENARNVAGPMPVRATRGQYTFFELAHWRDLAFENVLGRIPGVITDDMDEGHNRVTIGVDPAAPPTTRERVMAVLSALGVPREALRFEDQVPITFATRTYASTTSPPTTTGNSAYALVGGLRISHPVGSAMGGCSIGFTATLPDASPGFITASHCSDVQWATDGTNFSQAVLGHGVVGYEVFDPAGGTCPTFWPCSTYRYSDAALVKDTSSARTTSVGVIARPRQRVSGAAGDTTLDATRPYLYVTRTIVNIGQGLGIEKIGATTGWTFGVVTSTCTDYIAHAGDPEMVRCVYKASAFAEGGDSGAPMFVWDQLDAVAAAGILMAKAGSDTWFSKWANVEMELTQNGIPPKVTIPPVTIGSSVSLTGSLAADGWPSLSWSSANAPK